MARIFISYRRDDAAGHAGRIYDQLQEDFGAGNVFMDVDAIEPGVDFVERIESAVAAADVFLAVLGRTWAATAGADGRRRLDDPGDYVRREVATALRRRMTVIPVLVGGAEMPSAGELPEELAPLTRRNALAVSDLDWQGGMRRLAAVLERELGLDEVEADADDRPDDGRRRQEPRRAHEPSASAGALLAGLVGAALLLAGTALRLDALLGSPFGETGTVPGIPAVMAPASIAVALGAAYAFLLAWSRGPRAREAGLLLGFAAAGAIKYASLLGRLASGSDGEAALGSGLSLLLGLGGSLALAGVAGAWLAEWHRREERTRVRGRVLAAAGAILMLAGAAIPFNVVSGTEVRTVLGTGAWEALDPVALAAAVLVAVVLAGRTAPLAVSGVLLALGLAGSLLWLRYVGVPVLQMLQTDGVASVRPGGAVGLAGGLLVWGAGLRAARARPDPIPAGASARPAR